MSRFKILLFAICISIPGAAYQQGSSDDMRPVVVQGAMPSETDLLVSRLKNTQFEQIGGWKFWRGTVDGYPVVVSRTLKGTANAAAATAIAIERYRPIAIINQGTGGGLEPSLHLYDIVLGISAVNLGAFKSPYRPAGEGSNALAWKPLNLMASEGSSVNDPNRHTIARFAGDTVLLAVARRAARVYTRGRVIEGVIGSSDMWNDEIDRITRFNKEFGATVEDMETAAAAQIAGLYGVAFLGIRVISDNTTNSEAYQPKTGETCEEFVFEVVKAFVAARSR